MMIVRKSWYIIKKSFVRGLLFMVCTFFIAPSIYSQDYLETIFAEAEKYNPNKYKNAIGTPYLYSDWVIGKVFNLGGNTLYPIIVNYNILKQVWEARHEDQVVALDPYFFWCVQIDKNENNFVDTTVMDIQLFIRGILPEDELQYGQILYNGKRLKWIKAFNVLTNSGKTIRTNISESGYSPNIDYYHHRQDHFITLDNQPKKVNMSIKDVSKVLGNKEDIKKMIEEINPISEADWIRTLEKVEEKFFPI